MRSESPRVAVLGPVRVDGRDPGGPLVRALLAALALEPSGAPRSVDALSADIWGDEPPLNPKAALQSLVSRARAAGDADIITTSSNGYALLRPQSEQSGQSEQTRHTGPGRVRAPRSDLELAHELSRRDERDPAARVTQLDAALALWLGEPGQDLGRSPVAEDLSSAAAALRDELRTERARALASIGTPTDLDEAARELHELLIAHPLDEARHAELMELLLRSGRASDALSVYAGLRTRLRDALGASPGAAITELNARILRSPGTAGAAKGAERTEVAPAAEHPQPRRQPVRIGLPVALSPLIGRDADIAETSELLRTHRLVTVLGAGGLGKTRLAVAVATACDAPSAVFVPLAGAREAADVLPAIAGVLGISETAAGARITDARALPDLRQRVLSALGERDTLLVLDNCEQVIDGVADWAADALAAVGGLRILATSRTPLSLAAEICRPLGPLEFDRETGSAVRLFVERARSVRPSAVLPLDTVARLCRRLDGLPLAIELAAARVRTMTPAQIETRLEDRFALLTGGDRGAPERHRTLEAVIEWSWELLEPQERDALAMLSVLPGGLSSETAVGVLRSGEVCSADTEVDEVLDRLVSQSLLVAFEDRGSDAIRFRMLETVREFGLARLRLDGAEDAAWNAVLGWGRRFALDRAPGVFALPGALGAPAYRVIRAEQDNLLAALRRAVQEDRSTETVLLLGVLAQSWTVRGAFTEFTQTALDTFDAVARAAGRTIEAPNEALALCLATCAVGLAGSGPSHSLRALALLRRLRRRDPELRPLWQGVSRMLESGLDAEATRIELEALRAGSDPDARLFAEMLVVQLAENDGEPELARIAAERTWRLATTGDEAWIAAMAAHSLAQLASQGARPAEALRWLEIGTAGFEDFGAEDEMGERGWLRGLALISVGRADEAEPMFRELTGAVDRTDDGMGLSSIGWFGIAEIERSRGQVDDAIRSFGRAISEFRDRDQRASPWYLIALSGYVSAACLDGSLPEPERARLAAKLRGRTIAVQRLLVLQRLRSVYVDRPVLGTALLGWSSWALGDPALRERGLDALALAEVLGARQDQPCLRLSAHREHAAEIVGAKAVDEARARARALHADERVPRAFVVLGAPVPLG